MSIDVKEATKKYTPAQLEYLSHACKRAALSFGWLGNPKDTNSPKLTKTRGYYYHGEPRDAYSAPEQSCVSLARRGGATVQESRKSINHMTMRWWVLTEEGIAVGLAEYKRQTGKDLLKEAAKAAAEQRKVMEREARIVKAIAKPFRGMNIRIGEGTKRKSKDLGVHIEKTIMGKGSATTVDFDRSMLEQLGKSIDALRKR